MIRKKIEIELLSDTCVSDGGIYNSAVDMDICQDSFGFPYIPGKRIKGCLRECALELNDWGDEIDITELFGIQGNERGQVIIKNAYIKDRNTKIETIKCLSDTLLFHPQNVLNCHSYVRTQTALDFDTGVADTQSLRTVRVANKGLIFEAEVLFLSKDSALLDAFGRCLAVFRHIGVSRTRGLGEIKAVLKDMDRGLEYIHKVENAPYVKNSTQLKYEIYLNEPVVCKSVGEQEASSMDYIEGAKILGVLGQRLKDLGDGEIFTNWLQEKSLNCSNAYPKVGGKRLYEIPASVFSIKNDGENYRNKIYMDSNARSYDEGLQLNRAKHCYVDMTEDGRLMKYSVEREDRYHHSRPEDKSIGRSINGVDGSQLYQISSIKEGQTFCGFIEGNCKLVKRAYELITGAPECMIGYGRNGEYGGCTIRVAEVRSEEEKRAKTNSFYALLKAPAIIYNDKAMYSTDVEDLKEEILANVIENGAFNSSIEDENNLKNMQVTKYADIKVMGGFNVTWGCRKPTIYAFDKGTVLVFRLPEGKECEIKTGKIWIGERCIEGFGETLICPLSDSGKYMGKIVDHIEYDEQKNQNQSEDKKSNIKNILKEEFVQKMLSKCFGEFLRYKASEAVKGLKGDMLSGIPDSVLRPTVSNMSLMCKENTSVKAVWGVCKNRFGKRSEGKDEKLKCAERIMKHMKGIKKADELDRQWSNMGYPQLKCLVEEFEKQYKIFGVYDEDKAQEWEMIYLRELLTQIKYALRQKETDKEVDDNDK